MLQEEKVFGPTTSNRGENQGPKFVRFSSHYIFVEDVTGTYRPIVVKEYSKIEQAKTATPPWPTLRKSKPGKSPFHRDFSSDNRPHEQTQEKKEAPASQDNQKPGANVEPKAAASHTPTVSLAAINNQQVDKLDDGNNAFAGTKPSVAMPSLSASGIHQFGTSRAVSTSSAVHGLSQPLPPTENITRLDRRMINNAKASDISPAVSTKAATIGDPSNPPQSVKTRTAKRHKGATGKRQPPPKNFCENCRQRFYDLKQVKLHTDIVMSITCSNC